MKNFLPLLILVVSTCALAKDEPFFSAGFGIFDSAKGSQLETKTFDLGYRADSVGGWFWQYKIGFWKDGSSNKNRSSSPFVAVGSGMKIDLNPVEIRTSWGVAGIGTTDGYLGGHIPQFNGELYLGVRDRTENGIGIKYEHFSSAGISSPNIGRDFIMLETSTRW